MGREIRRVPANWQHPEIEDYRGKRYQPMYERCFESAMNDWLADFDRIRQGNLTDIEKECYGEGLAALGAWMNDEKPPNPSYYVPYKPEDTTWFQAYETVSEGTPVSPAFATEDELIQYLCDNGDFWDQKRGDKPLNRGAYTAFVRQKHAFSMVVTTDGRAMSGVEFCQELEKSK